MLSSSPFSPSRPAPTAASPTPPPPPRAPERAEPLVMAKELMERFATHGVNIGYKYARAILRQCPQTVAHRYIRFSDAWAWWNAQPQFRPFVGLWAAAQRRTPARKSTRRRPRTPRT